MKNGPPRPRKRFNPAVGDVNLGRVCNLPLREFRYSWRADSSWVMGAAVQRRLARSGQGAPHHEPLQIEGFSCGKRDSDVTHGNGVRTEQHRERQVSRAARRLRL